MLTRRPFGTRERGGLLLILAVATLLFGTASRAHAEASFEIYGMAMLDYIQDFKRVDPDWSAALRPSKIPTVSGQFGSDGEAIISVRQSRFGIKGSTPLDGGDELTFKFDFDLFGVGDNAGQTTMRLQNIYAEWRQLLAGQTETGFMDLSIFPDSIEYWGPPGMAFVRSPQLRLTPIRGPDTFTIGIERPNNDIDAGQIREIDPGIAGNLHADNRMPDLTSHYRDWGHVQVSGILRYLGFETLNTPGNAPTGHEVGWGVNLTSNIKSVGDDLVHLGLAYGHGIASYMNDGGVDLAPTCSIDALGTCLVGTIKAKAAPLLGVTAFYDHYWMNGFSTSIGYSQTHLDNTNGQTPEAFQTGQYALINLLWRPVKNVMMGGEFQWGQRKDKDGQTGSDSRVQFSVQYKFSSK
jgi:hypothetical protein